jgi:hypothetical protein
MAKSGVTELRQAVEAAHIAGRLSGGKLPSALRTQSDSNFCEVLRVTRTAAISFVRLLLKLNFMYFTVQNNRQYNTTF